MEIDPLIFVLCVPIGFLTVVAMLYIICVRALHETTVHDLKVETHRLRLEYAQRIAALRATMQEDVEVKVISPGSPARPDR